MDEEGKENDPIRKIVMDQEKRSEDLSREDGTDVHLHETRDASFCRSSQPDETELREDVDKIHKSESKESVRSGVPEPVGCSVLKATKDSRIENDDRPVCENGVLDLSRCGLSKINRKFRKDYANVKKLIISGNMFTKIDGLDMFKQCIQVDATDNQLEKLNWFLPFAKQLRVLLLSNNGITSIECLRSFVSLEVLDVSCNEIKTIPSTLDNAHLLRLDLSSNEITSLPDLTKLSSLMYLDVSSNNISSLKSAVLPERLVFFNISSNSIEDLTEFMRMLHLKKLESISLANNPCVSNPAFDYRVYILSVLPLLHDIDGFVVTEEEQLKGEWLYSQGKGRAFKPDSGAHGSLVKYLEKYCPFNVNGKRLSSLDQSVVKVMEKRREMLNNSVFDDDSSLSLSLHSPYGAWASHLHEGKENQIPSSSADESNLYKSFSTKTPKSSTPARMLSIISKSVEVPYSDSRSSTLESTKSSSTVTLAHVVATHQKELVNVFPRHVWCSDQSMKMIMNVSNSFVVYFKEFSLRNSTAVTTAAECNRSEPSCFREKTMRPNRISSLQKESEHPERNNQRSSAYSNVGKNGEVSPKISKSKESNADRNKLRRPKSAAVVTDISMDAGPTRSSRKVYHAENDIVRRITSMENHIESLIDENKNITRINDELSRLLVEMTDRFTKEVNLLKTELGSLATLNSLNPCNLRVSRELGEGCYEIIWDMPLVKCFKVLTNGEESGVVRAPNNAARISDVEIGAELCIQVQASA
ncbi:leucine Rich repeat-containing domain protein [Dictyocaulus viviparus]|uniref:Leucine Rich repeat-containing domain protein n=1 Tax=Dictyocaulus viviparus TaxID=29172 RepID=A0A0D8Y1M1_DICVI|nr:leucine Rich repeat-containing domain protein [Dictyocaulus viviparus]